MNRFEFFRPATLDSALALMTPSPSNKGDEAGGTVWLAGGQSLLAAMKLGMAMVGKAMAATGSGLMSITTLADASYCLGSSRLTATVVATTSANTSSMKVADAVARLSAAGKTLQPFLFGEATAVLVKGFFCHAHDEPNGGTGDASNGPHSLRGHAEAPGTVVDKMLDNGGLVGVAPLVVDGFQLVSLTEAGDVAAALGDFFVFEIGGRVDGGGGGGAEVRLGAEFLSGGGLGDVVD